MVAKLRAPGFPRAGSASLRRSPSRYGLTALVRAPYGFDPVIDGDAVTIVALIAAPFGFFIGLGAFDYWFYWASGRPTRPEEHSSHGAHTWRDYFRVNTDHKVIGIQYVVTSFFFLLVGGLIAMLMRAELARPGMQFVDSSTFNGLFSVHASILIFLFIIPVFAGLANFVLPLMIGAPDMAFPRLNALSYWLLPRSNGSAPPSCSSASAWSSLRPLPGASSTASAPCASPSSAPWMIALIGASCTSSPPEPVFPSVVVPFEAVAEGFAVPALFALVAKGTPHGRSSTAQGIFGAAGTVALIVASIAAGMLWARDSTWPFIFFVVGLLVSLALGLAIYAFGRPRAAGLRASQSGA